MTPFRERIEARFNSSRTLRRVLTVGLCVVGLVLIAIALKKSLTRDLDLNVVLNASRNVLAGNDIYASPASNGAYYLYLPLLACLFIPLALLPQSFAGAVWTLACIALIAWSLHASIRLIGVDGFNELSPFERSALYLVPTIFCADAISSEVGNAQVNCLILASSVLAWKLARSRRKDLAGAVLGIATVAKIFAAPLLLYGLINKRFRIVAAGLMSAAAALLLPAILIGWQTNLAYLRYWFVNVAFYGDVASHRSGFAGNASIQAVITRLLVDTTAFVSNGTAYHLNIASLDPAAVQTIGMFFPGIVLLLLVSYFVLFRHRQQLISNAGAIALAFSIAPLITPIVERPHFVMLLPAYVYVSWRWLHDGIHSKLFYSLLVAAFVLSTFTLKLYVGEFWGSIFWSLGAPTLADLCLIAAIFAAARHQNAPDLTVAE